MLSTIQKRDGKLVSYDRFKIITAINKAIRAVQQEADSKSIEKDFDLSVKLAGQVEKQVKEKFQEKVPIVEEIQDVVEHVLIQNKLVEASKAYILYRDQHSKLRNAEKLLLNISNTMDGYLKQDDWRVNENANVNYSLGGLILHNSGTVTANYWLNHIYSKDVGDAHRNGDLHLHDLSMFSGYCAGWSLRDLLIHGLGGIPGKITSRPAKHLSTIVNQMVNFLGILQNEWAGAMAFSSFDTFLAPFVKIDEMSYKEVKQNVQSFVFGVNTPSRWGSQSPFTNITLDWNPPKDLKGEAAIVGGRPMNFTYGDCQKEMDMINRSLLEIFVEGDAENRGFSYPIPTYNLTEDFDWESDNAKLLFEITGKYGTPYFQNFINSDLDPDSVRSMCCHLTLSKDAIKQHQEQLKNKGGGLFGSVELTGSLGVVTINLPRIGFLSKDEGEYFRRLDKMMDVAKESLETKRKVLLRLMDSGLFPYSKRYLAHGFGNHFSTIGLIGMNESVMNFMDKNMLDQEAIEFAQRVLEHMRDRLLEYQKDTMSLYNLEATPGEGTSYRLAKIDKEKFPEIKTAGDKDPYYTNSTTLPVNATTDIFEALELQDGLQTLYTGGTVFHGFLGESIDDPSTCAKLVKTIATKYHLPYFTVTPTFSICEEHGYIKGEEFSCPTCNNMTEVYSRIVGYYQSLKNWNKGKKSEYYQRKEYNELKEKKEVKKTDGEVLEVA